MQEECPICKASLVYLDADKTMECAICHKREPSKTRCQNGHYVCNGCHTRGMDAIRLPHSKELPPDVIREVAVWCYAQYAKEETMRYEYDAALHEIAENGGAYVIFPWDLKQETGKGRIKVHATFDGIPYDGSIVNMGLKHPDGSVCYVIGVLKAIRAVLNKRDGDTIHVILTDRV